MLDVIRGFGQYTAFCTAAKGRAQLDSTGVACAAARSSRHPTDGLAGVSEIGRGWSSTNKEASMTIRQIATCAGLAALAGAMLATSGQPVQALKIGRASCR